MKLLLTPAALSVALLLVACDDERDTTRSTAAPQSSLPTTGAPLPPPAAASVPAPAPAASTPPAAPAPEVAPAPVVVAQPPTSASSSSDATGIEVRRLILATRVIEREPEAASAPRVGEPLLAFIEARNGTPEDEKLIVTFEHESGAKVGFVELGVPGGAKRWRTWARTRNVNEAGRWEAVVRTESGKELGRTTFTVNAG